MYTKETCGKVLDFIKKMKETHYREIIKLGSDKRRIDQKSLNEILTDLEEKGTITVSEVGGVKVIRLKEAN